MSLHNDARTVGPTWKLSRLLCEPRFTKRVPPPSPNSCSLRPRRRLSVSCSVVAVAALNFKRSAPNPLLTVVGPTRLSRPYYWCAQCGSGQFPLDVELDIENTAFSPGVRRMQALVGQEAPFDQGREQMKILAGLEATAKSVERAAEAIGAEIARGEQEEIKQALQLPLPAVASEPIPILYVEMDGTGVPVVKKETAGRQGKIPG